MKRFSKLFLMTTLLSVIFSSTFAMNPRAAKAHYPFVAQLIKGEAQPVDESFEERNARLYSMYAINSNLQREEFEKATEGSVAVIPIQGTMMKDDWCGIPGTSTFAKRISQADANPNIKATLLHFDTGGGQADGLETLANAIKGSSKPVIAFVDTWAASAGYFVASATDEIIMSEKSSMVGSIGTMISIYDDTKYWEEMGIKFHDIYSTFSPDKNDVYAEALAGNYKPMQEQVLDPHVKIFHAQVKEGRDGKLDLKKENSLTGKMYYSEDAIAFGLADKVGSFAFAIERAKELASESRINFS